MKKIVIEQGGNAISFSLFTVMAIDCLHRSSASGSAVRFAFGWPLGAFVVWMAAFALIRHWVHRRDPHFDLTAGEQSAADERERLVSLKTSQRTLQVVITLLLIAVVATTVSGIVWSAPAAGLWVAVLTALGGLLVAYCLVFIGVWGYFDRTL